VEDQLSIAAFLMALGDLEEAHAVTLKALEMIGGLQFDRMLSVAVQRAAAIASSWRADDVRCARLLGFADALLTPLGGRRDFVERQEYDHLQASLHKHGRRCSARRAV